MQKKITTLVIDMYGVILKEPKGNFIPYTFSHFDKSEHERLRRQFEEKRLFTKAGYGDISSHEFLSLLGYQDTEFHMRDYIENHLSFDSSFIDFAEKYYQTYDFVLLSTDVSEWSAYITKYFGLDKYFKHKIVSGDVHCRKPDPKIYEMTLQKANKKANECLFIDDSINNLLAAKEMGIGSILFDRYDKQDYDKKVLSFQELDALMESLDNENYPNNPQSEHKGE